MGEHKRKKSKDITEDTMLSTEVGFYQYFIEVMDLAYKKDGMRGVLQVSADVVKHANGLASISERESPRMPNMTRAIVAADFFNEWFPACLEVLKTLPDSKAYWEDADGNPVDFPKPGTRLRTGSESAALADAVVQAVPKWLRARDGVPESSTQ